MLFIGSFFHPDIGEQTSPKTCDQRLLVAFVNTRAKTTLYASTEQF